MAALHARRPTDAWVHRLFSGGASNRALCEVLAGAQFFTTPIMRMLAARLEAKFSVPDDNGNGLKAHNLWIMASHVSIRLCSLTQ